MRLPVPLRALCAVVVTVFTGTILSPYVDAAESNAVTLEALREQYPDATFVRVDAETLRIVMTNAPGHVIVTNLGASLNGVTNTVTNLVFDAAGTNAATNVTSRIASNRVERVEYAPPPAPAPPDVGPAPGRSDYHSHGSLLFDLSNMDWGGGGDAAVILYVLIGVVVVGAFIIYTADYIYHVVAYPGSNTYWWSLDLYSAWIAGDDENGFLVGPRLSTGFVARDAHAGLSLEAGYFDIDIEVEDGTSEVGVDGAYGMVGPHIRWLWSDADGNPSHAGVELLVGTTTDGDIDLLSVARFNLSVGVGRHARAGFSIGAIYMDVEADEGLIRDESDFSLIVGGQVGIRL